MADAHIKEYVKEEPIKGVFESLPPVIQNAIINSGWEQKIRIIAKSNNLAIGDASILEKNTFLVMLGIIRPSEYGETLKQEIAGLDTSRMNNIISSVEEQIFQSIRKDLIELEEKEDAEELNDQGAGLPFEQPKGQVPNDLPTEEGVVSEAPQEITRASVAKEMEEHVEILPEESEDFHSNNLPTTSDDALVLEKLKTATETPKETITIDPYRELPN